MPRRLAHLCLIAFFASTPQLLATMAAAQSPAQENPAIRTDTPSGLPVPRFVSLKAEKTFCRAGPTFAHRVQLTFMKRGLPVIVVAETRNHWRKIRDAEGDECWIHRSKLSGTKTAIVVSDGLALHAGPRFDAPQKARLGRGVVAKIEANRDGWVKITSGKMKGWARESGFWGASTAHSAAQTRPAIGPSPRD